MVAVTRFAFWQETQIAKLEKMPVGWKSNERKGALRKIKKFMSWSRIIIFVCLLLF